MTRDPALLYTADAVDTGRPMLMGRHAAGEGFFRAWLKHSQGRARLAVRSEAAVKDFKRRAEGWGFPGIEPEWMAVKEPRELQKAGCLYVPDPILDGFAWRRRALGNRAYSLCGVNHTIASERVIDGMAAMLTAPLQPWDALICTSRAVKTTLLGLFDTWGGYLQERLGTRARPQPTFQMPVIPLGVDCDRFAPGGEREAARRRLRERLGIEPEDLAVLFLGRLSYHAKAHPQPMFVGLEAAARLAPGRKLHLLLAGWFANEPIESEFRKGAAAFCPSVPMHVVDARDGAARTEAWAAADLFVSFSDNIQETFGLTPIEAMAAGLPAVVSDWNGYRDTVRHGVDGFRIPTLAPEPGSCLDLALPAEPTADADERDRVYNRHCGVTSQCTVVDPVAATEALVALIGNPDLRRRMGEAGRRQARDRFDWKVVIAAYRLLWEELDRLRAEAPEVAPRRDGQPANPLRDDPFRLFAAYPTAAIDARTLVSALPGADGERLRSVKSLPMNDVAGKHLPSGADLTVVLAHLEDGHARPLGELAAHFPPGGDHATLRGIAWLGKMGLARLAPQAAPTPKALAYQALKAGEMARAGELFQQALRADPGDGEVVNTLGEVLLAGNQPDKAAALFRQAMMMLPAEPLIHRNLGLALMQAGRPAAAAEPLRRAVELAPGDPEPRLLAGVAARRAGDPAGALEWLGTAILVPAAAPRAFFHMGLALKSLGQLREALAAFGKGLALAPGDVGLLAARDSLELALKGEPAGERIGLFLSRPEHYPLLRPAFEALAGHRPLLIGGDLDEMAAFAPDKAVAAEPAASELRRRLPGLGLHAFPADAAEAGRLAARLLGT